MKSKHLPRAAILFFMQVYLLWPSAAAAQPISLQVCLQRADSLSPLRQQDVHQETLKLLSEENIGTGWYPKVALNGHASYQSDVFSFPDNPFLSTPIIPKDQYRVALELSQPVYDGGMVRHRKAAEAARIDAEQAGTRAERYAIRSAVSRLYFAALMQEAHLKILAATRAELGEQLSAIEAGIRHGVLLPSTAGQFRKSILGLEQQQLEAQLDRRALIELLGKWIGQELPEEAALAVPDSPDELPGELNRPELRAFDRQSDYFESLKGLSAVPYRPQLAVFAQAGFGQPNPLNFLETDFNDFYLAGIRLQWNLLNYGQLRRERDQHATQQLITANRRQLFTDDLDRKLVQQQAEIEKLGALLEKDLELIGLQRDIAGTAYAQLQNGIIQSTDYLSERTELTRLEIGREMHRIRLLEARYRWLDLTGNL